MKFINKLATSGYFSWQNWQEIVGKKLLIATIVLTSILLSLSAYIFSVFVGWLWAVLTIVFVYACHTTFAIYENAMRRFISRANNWFLQKMHKPMKGD